MAAMYVWVLPFQRPMLLEPSAAPGRTERSPWHVRVPQLGRPSPALSPGHVGAKNGSFHLIKKSQQKVR